MAAEFAPQEREDALSSNCIGELEHHIHKVFASVRVPGEDFVYHANNDLFTYIEDYVNEQWTESKPPLLILGESGLGKSALLSNWLDRRTRNMQRSRAPNDEFVFWHAVGCSRQSTNVNNLIRRLIIDLKTKFQVTRELPVHSERLSWELPRFLDLASKKGKIIIVIDGVNRLMSDEENEATLAWLPFEVPSNVRFVLSATIPSEGTLFDSKSFVTAAKSPAKPNEPMIDYSGKIAMNYATDPEVPVKKGRVLQELERREWKVLRLRPLDRTQCRSLIMSFIQKTVQAEVASQATGVFLTAISNASYGANEILPGFLLFESQINSLLNHKQGRTPLFLRLFLRCAYLLCIRGFSLWTIWDDWLHSDNVNQLYVRVLASLESGFTRTSESQRLAVERALHEGGFPAIKKLYSWHPAFQVNPEENSDTLAAVEYAAVTADKNGQQNSNLTSQALSNSVLQSLGDQHWLSAAETAEAKFEAARKKTDRLVHDTFVKAHKDLVSAGKGDLQLMDAICSTMKPTKHTQIAENCLDGLRATNINHLGGDIDEINRMSTTEDEDGDEAIMEGDEDEEEDDSEGDRNQSDVNDANTPRDSTEPPAPSFLTMLNTSTKKGESSRNLSSPKNSADSPKGLRPSQLIASMPANAGRSSSSVGRQSKAGQNRASEKLDMNSGGTLASLLHRATSVKSMSGKRSLGVGVASKETVVVVDPKENINQLPLYLRGGVGVNGLGKLLGNALSLLYVSRHGLKEHEIWAMLATMTTEGASGDRSQHVDKENSGSILPPSVAAKPQAQRTLISIVYDERGSIEDVWRTDDCMATGMIPFSAFVRGIRVVLPKFTKSDLHTLLDIINMGLTHNPNSLFPEDTEGKFRTGFGDHAKINYQEVRRRVEYLYALAKKSDIKQKLTSKVALSMDAVDRLDAFVVQDDKSQRHRSGGPGSSNEWENFSICSDTKKTGGFDDFSLGPIIEESLLVVLCSLGVLHSPENQVLLLPIDSDMFREVVCEQYVEHRGGEIAWHDKLIKHFQREANCMRRCEELPWHLQLCRKWYILKDTLTDLRTFELMYGSDLKDELMSYWITLTEGPLYVTDEAEKAAILAAQAKPASARNRNNGPQTILKSDNAERYRILSELDSAAALGLSEKEARKQLMKDKIAPFDVVEEFNRSVENWIYQSHPSATQLHHVVSQISFFMADFSRHITIIPSFLRLGVEMKGLTAFGVNVSEVMKSRMDLVPKSTEDGDKEDGHNTAAVSIYTSGSKKPLAGDDESVFPTPKMLMATHLYPYFRWIWIQFAWLALPSAGAVGKKYYLHDSKYVIPASALPGGERPTTTNAPEVTASLETERPGESVLPRASTANAAARYWEVLKQDPSTIVLQPSESQKVSAIRSRTVKSASNLHILENNAHNLHLLDCRLFGGKPGHPNYIKLNSAKYRRSMEDEMEASKGIPFSDHTVRSLRLNTLFPTVEQLTKQKNDQVELEDMNLFDKAKKVEMWGGKMAIFQNDLTEDLKKSLEVERLNNFNQLYAGIFPLSEFDAEIERESNRMGKMRNYLDKAVQMRRERQAYIKDLQRQLQTREQDDNYANMLVASGESAIQATNERLNVLTVALEEALQVEAGFEKIIDLMERCPPFHDHHLAEVEQNLALARQQLADMIAYRRNIYLDAEKARTLKKHQLQSKIGYYRDARIKVAQKRRAYILEHGIIEDDKSSRSDSFSLMSDNPSAGAALLHRSRSPERSTDQHMQTFPQRDAKTGASKTRPGTTSGGKLRERLHSHLHMASAAQIGDNSVSRSPSPGRRSMVASAPLSAPAPSAAANTAAPEAAPRTPDIKQAKVVKDVVSSVVGAFRRVSVLMKDKTPIGSPGSGANSDDSEDEASLPGASTSQTTSSTVALAMQEIAKETTEKEQSKDIKSMLKKAMKKKATMQYTFDKDSLLQNTLAAFNRKNIRAATNKHAREKQSHMHITYILEQTGSSSEAEFLDRFAQATKMTETLKGMQSLVDSKLAQLRAEHNELYGAWGESNYSEINKSSSGMAGPASDDKTNENGPNSPSHRNASGANVLATDAKQDEASESDSRYFDTSMSRAEMKLARVQKALDKSLKLINDCRTGTGHLMELLTVNSKLLHSLPKSITPKLDCDEDIVKCLSWMEERILGINEAIMLDAGKPQGGVTDDTKSLPARQTELAQLVQNMLKAGGSFDPKSYKKKKGRKAGDLSRNLIDATDTTTYVSNIKSVVVKSVVEQEKNYELEMRKLEMTRDKEAQKEEKISFSNFAVDSELGLERFLSESLDTNEAHNMLRKANILTHSKQNERAGFGWTLEGMLRAEGQGNVVVGQHLKTDSSGAKSISLSKGIKSPDPHAHGSSPSKSPKVGRESPNAGNHTSPSKLRRPTTSASMHMTALNEASEEDSQGWNDAGAAGIGRPTTTPAKGSPRKTLIKTPMNTGSAVKSRTSSMDMN